MNSNRILVVLAVALMLLAGTEVSHAMPQGKSRGGGGASKGGGMSKGGGGGMSRGGGGSKASSGPSFPKYTPSGNSGASSNQHRGSYNQHQGHDGRSGYTQPHYNQFHADSHYGGNKNYGNRYRANYGGFNYLNISPYGLGYSYYNNGFGLSIGTARYYPPNYGYADYYRVPSSTYYYGGSYGIPYDPYGTAGYPVDTTVPYSSYTDVLAAHDLLSTGEVVAGYPPPATDVIGSTVVTPMIRTASPEADRFQAAAEQAFREGRYEEASRLVDQALDLDSTTGYLYLFGSQTKFAIGQYELAVDQLEAATQLLPPEQWGYVVQNFRNFYGQNDYVTQTNALSDRIAKSRFDADARLLRGYQYGALGYPDAATKDFVEASKLNPDDVVIGQLQAVFGKDVPLEGPVEVEPPKPAGVSDVPVGSDR